MTPGQSPALVVAPAKLTCSLRITGVRPDGYHLIDAELVTLDLHDELLIDAGRFDTDPSTLRVVGGGPDVPRGADNLVLQALELAGRTAAVTLTKRIPSRAGLGGGSADAAAVLRWAGVDDIDLAVSLGADVGFCLIGGRARVRGIGDRIDPLDHVDRTFTLLTPPLACPTPAVYTAWDDLGGPTGHESGNDLEPAALRVEPELARWRDELGDATGIRPTLAGSGSTWFVPGAHAGPGRVVTQATASGWSPGREDR